MQSRYNVRKTHGEAKVKVRYRVKELAESRGLDRAKLARQADVTYETIHSLWRNPYRDVSMSTLLKIARALGVGVTDLYEEVED